MNIFVGLHKPNFHLNHMRIFVGLHKPTVHLNYMRIFIGLHNPTIHLNHMRIFIGLHKSIVLILQDWRMTPGVVISTLPLSKEDILCHANLIS